MKFQVVKIENGKQEVAPNGSSLTLGDAELLLDDLRVLELCSITSRVTPIITLWHSTRLSAFAVSKNGRHYEYIIMVDHFTELGNLIKPNKVYYPIHQQN